MWLLSFALSHLVYAPCFHCPTAIAICPTTSRWWISSETIFLLFIVDSLDHQHCGWRPRTALTFSTVPIISFILYIINEYIIAWILFCNHWFHAILLRQSSGRERKILEKLKNTVKRILGLYTTFFFSFFFFFFFHVCVDYICVLLCVVVLPISFFLWLMVVVIRRHETSGHS